MAFEFAFDQYAREKEAIQATSNKSNKNTRDSVSSRYSNTVKRSEKSFDDIRRVSIAHETLSRVFDICSLSKQKLRNKKRSKIIKIYAD